MESGQQQVRFGNADLLGTLDIPADSRMPNKLLLEELDLCGCRSESFFALTSSYFSIYHVRDDITVMLHSSLSDVKCHPHWFVFVIVDLHDSNLSARLSGRA